MCVVIAEAWRATSIIMIILVAGLQSIPREYLEAADVYGATTWQRIRRVVLPMLRPSLQVALILRTILAFQVFATVIALAGSGLDVLAGEAQRWATDIDNDHVAAAYAGLILVLSLFSTVLFLVLLPAREEHQA
jgi:multiple sugar transport system permease protein